MRGLARVGERADYRPLAVACLGEQQLPSSDRRHDNSLKISLFVVRFAVRSVTGRLPFG